MLTNDIDIVVESLDCTTGFGYLTPANSGNFWRTAGDSLNKHLATALISTAHFSCMDSCVLKSSSDNFVSDYEYSGYLYIEDEGDGMGFKIVHGCTEASVS